MDMSAQPRTHTQDDDDHPAEHREQGPQPSQVGAVGHPGDGQATHHHGGGGDEQVHQAGRALEGGHDHGTLDTDEGSQRRHDRHRDRREPGGGGDQERQRQEQQEHHDRERHRTESLDGLLGPVQHGVGDAAVGHHHGDATRDADDQGDPEEVTRTVDERVGELGLAHLADEADDDREHDEGRGHLREPPPQSGDPDAHVLPGDDAVHHHQEGQAEHREDRLLTAGHDGRLLVSLDAEVRLVRLLHAVHQRLGRVLLDSVGVAHHEEDPEPQAGDENDQP